MGELSRMTEESDFARCFFAGQCPYLLRCLCRIKFHRHERPVFRTDIGHLRERRPTGRGHHDFVAARVEPSSPPRERAIANDMVAAATHEQHVLPTLVGLVPRDKGGILERQMRRGPFDVV